MIVRVQIPESKLWHFLNIAPQWLRRTHQANPRKDERVIYFHCNPEMDDQKHLEKAVNSLHASLAQ